MKDKTRLSQLPVTAVMLMIALIMAFCFSACGQSEDAAADTETAPTEDAAEEPAVDGSAYGFAGDDPVEAAVYRYLVEEVSKNYDETDVSIPTVNIVAVDYTNEEEIIVYGDFWIDNYNIEGETLKCVSGGNHPGVMHLLKNGDGYVVESMDALADGGGFDTSAKELFGQYYDDFMKVYSDSEARDELRKITVTDYVNLNGLSVTEYQDEGWNPIALYQ